MRYALCFLILSLCTCVRAQIRLDISEDGTHLVHSDSRAPFFYLGDTAWELLHRCTEQEIRDYLIDRASKGFNVIQCVALAELDGLTVPNTEGDLPLTELDPARPNEDYFLHVDFAARIADSLDLFLGLLPTWGDKFNKKWGVGPEIFNPQNAETYANYLGLRYANNNIIWILGGDRNPEEPEDLAIIRAMAKGLRVAVEDLQLITYHPQGGFGSTDFFSEDEWIDFHMFQSGHGRLDDKQNYDFPRKMKSAAPDKPVINGEPAYEDHPVNWRPVNGWFTDFDTRQAAWWSVLAGSAGHTFGNHNIWQMWRPGREPISSARTDWHEALHWPAAAQVGHVRKLMVTLPYWELSPDFNLFEAPPNSSGREVLVARTELADLVVAYTPYGDVLRLNAGRIPPRFVASWFDPRTGESFGFTPKKEGDVLVFDPPFDAERGNDWVLVIQKWYD
ncbi:apiosidase-like domain-containing protein [Neolewinella persica]|uniref:apiosidase-like domain-containing protein n=1 Tax=Neolewinella persica TaxID=70998 RepID=UPI0008FBDA56|nr:DUF4038 domain-containing protein [Neolewinella persica]